MIDINSSVDNIHAGTLSSAVVVGVSGRTRFLVRQSGKTPVGVLLAFSRIHADSSILLDVIDLKRHLLDLLSA